jgi:hypothetical protein
MGTGKKAEKKGSELIFRRPHAAPQMTDQKNSSGPLFLDPLFLLDHFSFWPTADAALRPAPFGLTVLSPDMIE